MKFVVVLVVVVVAYGLSLPSCQTDPPPCTWPNSIPSSCPLPRSTTFNGINLWSDWNQNQTGADTWYPSWGSDDKLYSSFTDGCNVNKDGQKTCCSSYSATKATTGTAIITGDNPRNLEVNTLGCVAEPAQAKIYTGRYPSANLMKDGVWFYGTYALANLNHYCGNWCTMGPFVGFRYSLDSGRSWILDSNLTVDQSIFGEKPNEPVQMGAPHIIDFGRNQVHSPDGLIYMVGTGCLQLEPQANCSWMSGDTINMARGSGVNSQDPSSINRAENWEFYGGIDEETGTVKWVKSINDIKPILTWERHTGVVTITYNPMNSKYFMAVSTPTEWPSTEKAFDTYLLESDSVTGPYKIGTYMQEFGIEAYFVHFPSKFLWGGLSGHLMYSANFIRSNKANPPSAGYHMCLVNYTLTSD